MSSRPGNSIPFAYNDQGKDDRFALEDAPAGPPNYSLDNSDWKKWIEHGNPSVGQSPVFGYIWIFEISDNDFH